MNCKSVPKNRKTLFPLQVAFVPQSPFIYNATVRENILFGLPYEEERYRRAIAAAALGADLVQLSGRVSDRVFDRVSSACCWAPGNESYKV